MRKHPVVAFFFGKMNVERLGSELNGDKIQ